MDLYEAYSAGEMFVTSSSLVDALAIGNEN